MLGEEEDGRTVKEMLSRWLDTLRNGPRPERMNFRMHRFSIIERSTDPSAGTITSSSMHSMPSLPEYSPSPINYKREGVIPSSSSSFSRI